MKEGRSGKQQQPPMGKMEAEGREVERRKAEASEGEEKVE
ncbi:hypothetical protein ANO11243_023530 [Dothideomycetidae sp. 11243]|nr:hypothetical protein ANO11243_023530 [fungal sp. No.11243]